MLRNIFVHYKPFFGQLMVKKETIYCANFSFTWGYLCLNFPFPTQGEDKGEEIGFV